MYVTSWSVYNAGTVFLQLSTVLKVKIYSPIHSTIIYGTVPCIVIHIRSPDYC